MTAASAAEKFALASTSNDEAAGEILVDENGVKYREDEFGRYDIDDQIWTMNEIRDHPLFMVDCPSDISENPHLLALQSLTYDGQTQEQMAEHFRNLGNEAFRLSQNKMASQNALMAYTKALEMDCSDAKMNAALHCNRAAVSLRLEAYDKVVEDCRRAIELDPRSVKAFFRAAKASEILQLTARALQFCNGGLKISPEDDELVPMKERLQKQRELEEKAHELERVKAAEDAQEKNAADYDVKTKLEGRGVALGPFLYDLSMYRMRGVIKPKLSEDGDAVVWPMMFLYPESCQSDFIESFDERCDLEDQLQLMFPEDRHPEWDEEGKYIWDRLVCYAEAYLEGKETKMILLKNNVPLQDQLKGHRVPRCLILHVLVARTPAHEHFISENHLD